MHRWAWTQKHCPVPAGMQVLHSCDNPPCYNVDHIFLGRHADNMTDRGRKGRCASILDAAKVSLIKSLLRVGGMTQPEIAKRFGVSRSAILSIKLGKNWKDVP